MDKLTEAIEQLVIEGPDLWDEVQRKHNHQFPTTQDAEMYYRAKTNDFVDMLHDVFVEAAKKATKELLDKSFPRFGPVSKPSDYEVLCDVWGPEIVNNPTVDLDKLRNPISDMNVPDTNFLNAKPKEDSDMSWMQ